MTRMVALHWIRSALGTLAIAALVGCAGDGDGAGAGGSAANSDLVFCVDETNRLRATQGKAALDHSAELEAYANTSAQDDTEMQSAHAHFSSTHGGGIAFAENECPSFLGWRVQGDVRNTIAQCLQAFYDEGPGGGHYENMMGDYGTLGCGVYVQDSGITIAQDYGQ